MVATSPVNASPVWEKTSWQNETSYLLNTDAWTAIVSIDRGRLVHFGPAASDASFVFAPDSRDEPIGWGGHRVWLGPQTTWPNIWPPDPAWEMSAPTDVSVEGNRLVLVMPPSWPGWPRITRVYEPDGDALACRVRIDDSGTRDVQVIQIVQTHTPAKLLVPPTRSAMFPEGFALLPPIDGRTEAMRPVELPPQVSLENGKWRLHQTSRAEKVGFLPEWLVAQFDDGAFEVGPGSVEGTITGSPDKGHSSQVYLGHADTPVIELEQLSPLLKAGQPAAFTMLLKASGSTPGVTEEAP